MGTVVDHFEKPIRNIAFNLDDGAYPQLKLLPVDVLIVGLLKALPRDSSSARTRAALFSWVVALRRDCVLSFFNCTTSAGSREFRATGQEQHRPILVNFGYAEPVLCDEDHRPVCSVSMDVLHHKPSWKPYPRRSR